MAPSVITFAYDVVCPFAYIASTQVEAVAARCGAHVIWKPVLLGGLYKLDKSAQGAAGSASDVMVPAKKLHSARDLQRQAARYRVPLSMPASHPQKSIKVQRLLCAISDNQKTLVALSKALYESYWVKGEDITSDAVITRYATQFGVSAALLETAAAKQQLTDNTQSVFELGGFGVPHFAVTNGTTGAADCFFGGDRLHFVERFAGNTAAAAYRHTVDRPMPLTVNGQLPTVKFLFDFSSPWTFLGFMQLKRLQHLCVIELVPVLLGAVFRASGGPMLPMSVMSDNKRAYSAKDLQDNSQFHNIPITFNSHFPLRTVTALRCAIVQPLIAEVLFVAAWQKDMNIADDAVLLSLLLQHGFDGERIMSEAQNNPEVKAKLTANTAYAVEHMAFGAPTFILNSSSSSTTATPAAAEELVFGQDRIPMVCDLLSGWVPPPNPFLPTAAAAVPAISKL